MPEDPKDDSFYKITYLSARKGFIKEAKRQRDIQAGLTEVEYAHLSWFRQMHVLFVRKLNKILKDENDSHNQ
jgi:hypothetical protein